MARPQRKAAAEAKARIHCAAAGGTPKRRCSKSPRAADAPAAPAGDEERRVPARERVRSAPGGPDAPEPAQVQLNTVLLQALWPALAYACAFPSCSASAGLSGVGDARAQAGPSAGPSEGELDDEGMPRGKEDGDEKAGPSAVKKEEEEASTAPLPEKVCRPRCLHSSPAQRCSGRSCAQPCLMARCRAGEAQRFRSPKGRRSALPLLGLLHACQ